MRPNMINQQRPFDPHAVYIFVIIQPRSQGILERWKRLWERGWSLLIVIINNI